MSNCVGAARYTLFVALVGATVAACGGSSGGTDSGKDARGDAAAADGAAEHSDAADAQSNDARPSDAGSDSGADAGDDASADAPGDVSSDSSADASPDSSSDSSTDAPTDLATDGSSDASGDTSADSAADASPDASNDAATDGGTDAVACESTNTPDNCGTCGTMCPGYQKPNDNVTCEGGNTCTFSCRGESYDVDGQLANGCEVTDSPMGNHTLGAAASAGSLPCTDDSSNPNIHGAIASDGRAHVTPAIVGFDSTTGSAPDWSVVHANGGTFCSNDLNLTLQVAGSSQPSCYKLTVITDKMTLTATASAGGTAVIAPTTTGVYSDNTNIFVSVTKTCSLALTENVTYSVTGHL